MDPRRLSLVGDDNAMAHPHQDDLMDDEVGGSLGERDIPGGLMGGAYLGTPATIPARPAALDAVDEHAPNGAAEDRAEVRLEPTPLERKLFESKTHFTMMNNGVLPLIFSIEHKADGEPPLWSPPGTPKACSTPYLVRSHGIQK